MDFFEEKGAVFAQDGELVLYDGRNSSLGARSLIKADFDHAKFNSRSNLRKASTAQAAKH